MTSAYPDDDDSARRRSTGPSSSADPSRTPPAVAPVNTVLTWGIIGTSNRVEPLTIVPGATGVVRLISNDVRYQRPPNEISWSEMTTEPGRFEMVWPTEPASARTLADLTAVARQAVKQNGPLPSGHPTLVQLDEAVFALATTVHRLHTQGWGVGLLTPTNVLLSPDANGMTATLVDLGFTWIGDFGEPPWDASPGRPDWLDPAETVNPALAVWDRPPAEQQFAQPTGGLFTPSLEQDLRTLSRVIAWALTGIPSRKLNPDGSAAEIWTVLQDMNAGHYSTAREALQQLRAHPPSSQFTAAPQTIELLRDDPSAKPKSSRTATLGGILAVCGVLAAAAGYVFLETSHTPESTTPSTELAATTTTTPTTAPTTTATNPDSSSAPAGDEASYASIPPDQVAERIARFRALAQAARDPESMARTGALRVKLFADWIDKCEVHATDTDPARRAEAGANLRKLIDAYEKLNQDFPPTDPKLLAQEKQWLEQYDRQAELLGWPR